MDATIYDLIVICRIMGVEQIYKFTCQKRHWSNLDEEVSNGHVAGLLLR